MAWYDRYKNLGIYNDRDQISTKGIKTRRYIDETQKTGTQNTTKRLNNARKQREGYGTENKEADENTRKRVENAFQKARPKRFLRNGGD